jgi:hypothetical protein
VSNNERFNKNNIKIPMSVFVYLNPPEILHVLEENSREEASSM